MLVKEKIKWGERLKIILEMIIEVEKDRERGVKIKLT